MPSSVPTGGWLPEHLDRWVQTGIVTAEQARAIARYEGVEEPVVAPPGQPGSPNLGLLAEAVSYLGIALMTASGALVTARFWKDLHFGGRLAIGLLVIIAGFAAAAVVERIGDQGARRLASFLQLFATGGVALSAGVIAVAAGSHDAGVTASAVGPPVFITGAVLWRNQERVLPFLSALAGLTVSAVGLSSIAGWTPTPTEKALTVWAAAVTIGVLGGWGRLHPALPALLVAEIASLVAALFVVDRHHAPGLILGLITALTALISGMALGHRSVEAISVVGCTVFLGYTLGLYVKGPAAAVAILVLGAVLVAMAIRAGLHHRGTPPTPGSHIRRPRIP